MRIKIMLENLLEGLKQPENRGVGHTRNAIQFAKSIGAMYVMPLIGSFHTVDKDFGNSRNLISMTQIENNALRSRRGPIVLDNYTVSFILEESLRGFRALEDMVQASENIARKAQAESDELRDQLDGYKFKLNEMREAIKDLNKKLEEK